MRPSGSGHLIFLLPALSADGSACAPPVSCRVRARWWRSLRVLGRFPGAHALIAQLAPTAFQGPVFALPSFQRFRDWNGVWISVLPSSSEMGARSLLNAALGGREGGGGPALSAGPRAPLTSGLRFAGHPRVVSPSRGCVPATRPGGDAALLVAPRAWPSHKADCGLVNPSAGGAPLPRVRKGPAGGLASGWLGQIGFPPVSSEVGEKLPVDRPGSLKGKFLIGFSVLMQTRTYF